MRRRLYFLLPDVAHCKALVTDLRNQGISDNQIQQLHYKKLNSHTG